MPSRVRREPCGIAHVVMRAISTISSVLTTLTDDGTISPCRLKLTTNAIEPSGVTWSVAGKLPSVTRPSGRPHATPRSAPAGNFHSEPNGVPCAVET